MLALTPVRGPLVAVIGPVLPASDRTVRWRDRIVGRLVSLAPALATLYVADLISPLHERPIWAFSAICAVAGWLGCVAAIATNLVRARSLRG